MILSTTHSESCRNSNSSLPVPLTGHQIAHDTTSNTAYFFGGGAAYDWQKDVISPSSDAIYKWNITENVWTQLSVTTPSSYFTTYVNTAVTINDVVYFMGMYDNDGKALQNTALFDLTTETWLDSKDINLAPYETLGGCVAHNNSHIFIVGGRSAVNIYSDKLQFYDVSNNMWYAETITIALIENNGWYYSYCYNVGADLYVFGGKSSPVDYLYGAWRYNTKDKWVEINLSHPIYAYGSAVYHAASNAIFIVGGWDNDINVYLDVIYVFDVDTENITDIWRMTEVKAAVAVAIFDDDLYIIGGESTDGAAVSTIEICSIAISTTASITTLNPITTKLTTTDYSTSETITTESETTSEDRTDTTHSYASDTSSIESTSSQIKTSREIDSTIITTIRYDDEANHIVAKKEMDLLLYGEIAVVLILILMVCVCGIYVMGYRKKQIKNEHDAAHILKHDDNAPEIKSGFVMDVNEEREEEENEAVSNSNEVIVLQLEEVNSMDVCGKTCDKTEAAAGETNAIITRDISSDKDNDDSGNDSDEGQTDSSSDHESMYENHQTTSGFETISGETNEDTAHTNK